MTQLTEITFKVTPDAWVDVSDLLLKFHPENSQVRWPHEKEAIARSFAQYGFLNEPIVVNTWNDKIVGGHGRVEVCYAQGYRGKLPVVYLNLPSELEHRRAMLRFNQARGHQDPELELRELQALITIYGRETVQADMAYLDEELASILQTIEDAEPTTGEADPSPKPNPRHLPVDVIFPWDSQQGQCCCVAIRAGLKYGIYSDATTIDTICRQSRRPRHAVHYVGNHRLAFDWPTHRDLVKALTPKYATICDVLTEGTSKALGVEHHALPQILSWAAELAQYAENVIITPRYNCVDQIPDQYLVGYHVPQSRDDYALPLQALDGRRVHLHGGTWKEQLTLLGQLEDVTSIVQTDVLRLAQAGRFLFPNGNIGEILDLLRGEAWLPNTQEVAFAISLGALGNRLNAIFAGSVEAQTVEDGEPEEDDR